MRARVKELDWLLCWNGVLFVTFTLCKVCCRLCCRGTESDCVRRIKLPAQFTWDRFEFTLSSDSVPPKQLKVASVVVLEFFSLLLVALVVDGSKLWRGDCQSVWVFSTLVAILGTTFATFVCDIFFFSFLLHRWITVEEPFVSESSRCDFVGLCRKAFHERKLGILKPLNLCWFLNK